MKATEKMIPAGSVGAVEGHNHPSDEYAEAVALFDKKRKQMSKQKAKEYVEKHLSKEAARYAYESYCPRC